MHLFRISSNLLLAVLNRKQKRFNQLADNMPDQIVRFLNSLSVVAGHNQCQITKRGHLPAVTSEQSYDSQFLLTRLLTRERNIRRLSRRRDRQAHVAFRPQRLYLTRKDIFESGVVADTSQHTPIRGQRDSRKGPAVLQKLIDHLA